MAGANSYQQYHPHLEVDKKIRKFIVSLIDLMPWRQRFPFENMCNIGRLSWVEYLLKQIFRNLITASVFLKQWFSIPLSWDDTWSTALHKLFLKNLKVPKSTKRFRKASETRKWLSSYRNLLLQERFSSLPTPSEDDQELSQVSVLML